MPSDVSGDDPNNNRFPFINLQKAMERARALFEAAGDHEMTVGDAFHSWGYSNKSSGGFQTVSALRQYGLVAGLRGANRLSLTPAAKTYFRDERPEERARLLRQFAVSPSLLGSLYASWGPNPPADHVARSQLKIDRDLPEQSARSILAIYKENIDFAKLKGDNKPLGMGAEIEGNKGSAPKDDLRHPPPPHKDPPQRTGLVLMDGERELSTGMLAPESSFRLIVSGKVGVKEIERLIRKLELDKEILADAEALAASKRQLDNDPDAHLTE